MHPGLHKLFYVPLSTGTVMDMYKAIAWQLGLPVERNRAAAYEFSKNGEERTDT